MHKGRVLHMHEMADGSTTSCHHKHYRLSCDQYDELLRRSEGRCEICHRFGSETSHRQLYIDHDKWRGDWAVRGLLCGRCNSMLEHEEIFTPEVSDYLSRSWFIGMLRRFGVEADPEEPDQKTTVRAGQACTWTRTEAGWWCRCGRHRRTRTIPKTWTQLVHAFGPHRIWVGGDAELKPP